MTMDDSFLRASKKDSLQNWYKNGFYKKDSLKCEEYKNAVVLPLKETRELQFGAGGVIVEDRYISDSGIQGRVGGYYQVKSVQYRDERVVYCGALIRQWGHFLVESVSRLWYALEEDQSVDRFVFISNQRNFANKDEIGGNYREFLELLGIWDKIEILTEPTSFREVLVPELGYSRKYYYTEKYKRLFEYVSTKAVNAVKNQEVCRKVFLSRSQLKKAHQNECGLDMLDNYFSENGYRILYPEKLSLSQLIWYLQKAEVCAAESGTLPHNFLFCQDGKTVEIVERQTAVNEIQANLDMVKNLDVTYIDAHFTIYPTLAGYGPYFIVYNKQLADFTEKKGYMPPDDKYRTESYLRNELRKFFREYRKAYGYQWGFEKWQLMYAEAYYEAYEDSCKTLGAYLNRTKPLFVHDYFKLHFIKLAIKRLVNR